MSEDHPQEKRPRNRQNRQALRQKQKRVSSLVSSAAARFRFGGVHIVLQFLSGRSPRLQVWLNDSFLEDGFAELSRGLVA